jgi:hypothetical protein
MSDTGKRSSLSVDYIESFMASVVGVRIEAKRKELSLLSYESVLISPSPARIIINVLGSHKTLNVS